MSDEFLTVSELNNFIRDVLNSGFPQALWVCGEIQGYERGRDKKHIFFELCEKDPDSHEIKARIGLVIFANRKALIEKILQKAENAFVLKDDIEVKFLCKVDFYPGHGQVRLMVEGIDPTYTLGKIAQDRQRLIALLKEKGILDKNKQLEMPRLPLSIGLITSYDSAAYHDFVDELKKSGYSFNVWVVNSIMQGKNAEASVSRAIQLLNQRGDIDVIVITRGGGSIAELSCFDSRMIAEAIAASPQAVLSGIGHEINITVTDLTAHTFAKTPTAIARFLIGRVEKFLEYLKDHALTLQRSTDDLIQTQQRMIARVTETLKRLPLSFLKEAGKESAGREEDLKKIIHLRLQTSRTKIQTYQKLIDVADPKNTLKRGFSITRDLKGGVIKSITDVKKASSMKTQLADGTIISDIKQIKKDAYAVRADEVSQGG
ncbi:MAG: exodeoxyribonuclease VII large subunit [Candidatus Omnitrophica bacterium]|nr:exodeoxyribonuclease VII large subunit [Candidatus Omnitrophota bacterium]